MVTGLSTDYERDCKVDIGSYVEASTDATVTNDSTERTESCIALGSVGNRQGSVHGNFGHTGGVRFIRPLYCTNFNI